MAEYDRAEPSEPDEDAAAVLKDFGIDQVLSQVSVRSQEYGKLASLEDQTVARRFILMMTDRYRVYSLGRFATTGCALFVWVNVLLEGIPSQVRPLAAE